MNTDRLLAMTDGVIAVIITIMVLELKAPAGADLEALRESWPVFLAYVLSFVYIAIYWNNHHHYFHLVRKVNGAVLWANFHLLFWLSLVPFSTGWMGEHPFMPLPTAVYGVSLLMPGLAWVVMQRTIYRAEGGHSALQTLLDRDMKGTISLLLYAGGVGLSFVVPGVALLCYAAVALIWLMPDRRIERLADHG